VIITFSGMDGAGKSTQIELLINRLNEEGYSTTKIWSRGGYTPGFVLLKSLLRKIMRKSVPPSGRSEERTRLITNPRMSRLWLSLAITDMIILYGINFRIQSLLGRIVTCDRYIDDTRLDFMLNFPLVRFEEMWLWKLLQWSTPKPDIAFLLLLPIKTSIERSKIKNEPFPDDELTLLNRLNAYSDSRLFLPSRYTLFDGGDSIDDISAHINDKVFEYLK